MEKCQSSSVLTLERNTIVQITDSLIDFNQAAVEAISNADKLIKTIERIERKCDELSQNNSFPADIHPTKTALLNTRPKAKTSHPNRTVSLQEDNLEEYISKIFGEIMRDNK